jgi:hypothetical protein
MAHESRQSIGSKEQMGFRLSCLLSEPLAKKASGA